MVAKFRKYLADIQDRDVLLFLAGFFLGTVVISLIAHFSSRVSDIWAWLDSFSQNFGVELFGAFMTFLLLEVLVGRRNRRAELIHRLGSNVNSETVRAVEELRERGWLTDGSLRGVDLYRANLEGANLHRADLQEAGMSHINLERAGLGETNLQGAYLGDANLRRADLGYANLRKARLIRANMEEANLFGTILQDANLFEANLRGSRLEHANLEGVWLADSNLEGAGIEWVNMRRANLFGAKLQGANLHRANLEEADLREAKLQGTNLRGANLAGAKLGGADLREAKLQGANLFGTKNLTLDMLRQAASLEAVTLPDGTHLPDDATTWREAFEAWCRKQLADDVAEGERNCTSDRTCSRIGGVWL